MQTEAEVTYPALSGVALLVLQEARAVDSEIPRAHYCLLYHFC